MYFFIRLPRQTPACAAAMEVNEFFAGLGGGEEGEGEGDSGVESPQPPAQPQRHTAKERGVNGLEDIVLKDILQATALLQRPSGGALGTWRSDVCFRVCLGRAMRARCRAALPTTASPSPPL